MTIEFRFPDVGEGIAEGEIVSWKVREGDAVKEHDVLCEIETDKAVVEIPSPYAGSILKIHHKQGETVKVGETLVTIETANEASVSVVGELPRTETVLPRREEAAEAKQQKEILATPAVRVLAKQLGVTMSSVTGSGPQGRVTDEDVRKHAGEKGEATETQLTATVTRKYDMYGYIERISLRGVRKAIAKNMVHAVSTAPHVTHMDEADVTSLHRHKEREKDFAASQGIHLTYLPFVVKAVIAALRKHPYLSASLDDDTQEIVLKKYYNIGVAVDTPDGLLVPVIKGADQKSILAIAKEIGELAERAAKRTIDLADLKGGTFTITNVGVYGGIHATPIINWPEVAILATGKIQDKVVSREGEIQLRKMMPLSLSFDHRVVDGAEAARFVNDLKMYLEDPDMLLVEEQ
ncbi:MAG: 2-oxo acid dehydrogenase subunit E2 [Candidatus Aenigmarchaeota archaeon]|nr:2-oxo acid dehydrogenase subunit E2 [Candidatus Aenigmarchaeota archaeon]